MWPILAFAAVVLLLTLVGSARALMGVSGADDAWTAVNAARFASGGGYGMPTSLGGFTAFDPGTTTGPPLVIAAAIPIRLLGNLDWVPGAIQLVFFVLLMLVAALVLARYVGWRASAVFMSIVLLFVMLVSVKTWYIGMLIGEPVAFGFLLVARIVLAFSGDRRAVLAAGLCCSLAILTKQISVFPVAGIAAAWALSVARDRGSGSSVGRIGLLAAGIISMPLAWEALKLVRLGLDGYRESLWASKSLIAAEGFGTGALIDRLGSFVAGVDSSYVPAAVLCRRRGWILSGRHPHAAPGARARVDRALAAYAWAGSAVNLAYVAFVSTLMLRYYWIAVAMAVVAAAAPLLALQFRPRLFSAVSLVIVLVAVVLIGPLLQLYGWFRDSTAARERANIVAILEREPSTPYAADQWSSILDVVYANDERGTWAYGSAVNSLRGKAGHRTREPRLQRSRWNLRDRGRQRLRAVDACHPARRIPMRRRLLGQVPEHRRRHRQLVVRGSGFPGECADGGCPDL